MPTHLDRSSLTALDPISSDWSLCCPVSTGHSRHPSPTTFSQSLCPTPTGVPFLLPVASRSQAQAFVWFRVKTDQGIVCLADHQHSITRVHGRHKAIYKNWKRMATLIQTIRIYSLETGMEFGIEKYALLMKKSGKRQITEEIELQN